MIYLKNMQRNILLFVLINWLQVQTGFTQNPYEVECRDQHEVCKCDMAQPECHFRLEIEELRTFASYTVTQQDDEVKTRGVAGDTYYFSETGFSPALPPPK